MRPADRVYIFPRRKAGEDASPIVRNGRRPIELTREAIAAMFVMPQPAAAQELGVSLTALKQVCRRLGFTRWPYNRKGRVHADQVRRVWSNGGLEEGAEACQEGIAQSAIDIDAPCAAAADADKVRSFDQAHLAQHRANILPLPHTPIAYLSDSGDSSYCADIGMARTCSSDSESSLSREAPADDECGDCLGWLVSCESDADSEHGRAWHCLQRCCQSRENVWNESAAHSAWVLPNCQI